MLYICMCDAEPRYFFLLVKVQILSHFPDAGGCSHIAVPSIAARAFHAEAIRPPNAGGSAFDKQETCISA
jgi:hypothetical protein